jgi:hypothetical protein
VRLSNHEGTAPTMVRAASWFDRLTMKRSTHPVRSPEEAY